MLNTSLGTAKFHQQIYRDFRLQLWRKQPRIPRYLLPWEEGSTEVDVELSWENPSTTVFIEMKYGSSLSPSTVNCNGKGAFAADQLIRNVRVGLHKCGWYREDLLFRPSPRNFVVMVFAPTSGNALVQKYRDRMQLLESIPFAEKLIGLPTVPFVGELRYSQLVEILNGNVRFMSQSERVLVGQLERYLDLKLSQL